MTYYVLRQIHPRGMSALAHSHATAVNLALAVVDGTMVHGDYLEWSDPDAKDGFIAVLRTQEYSTIAMYEFNEQERSIVKIPLRWDAAGWSGRFMHRSRDQSLN